MSVFNLLSFVATQPGPVKRLVVGIVLFTVWADGEKAVQGHTLRTARPTRVHLPRFNDYGPTSGNATTPETNPRHPANHKTPASTQARAAVSGHADEDKALMKWMGMASFPIFLSVWSTNSSLIHSAYSAMVQSEMTAAPETLLSYASIEIDHRTSASVLAAERQLFQNKVRCISPWRLHISLSCIFLTPVYVCIY